MFRFIRTKVLFTVPLQCIHGWLFDRMVFELSLNTEYMCCCFTEPRFGDSFDTSSRITGLTVRENVVLFSDADTNTIKILDLTTDREAGVVVRDLRAPGSLLIYHPASREGELIATK